MRTRFCMAEDTGFEPAEAFTSTVFKTAALNRSANSPIKVTLSLTRVVTAMRSTSNSAFKLSSLRVKVLLTYKRYSMYRAGNRTQTCNILITSEALYQLRYTSNIKNQLLTGAEYQIRTGDVCLEGRNVTTTLIVHKFYINIYRTTRETNNPIF